MKTSNKILLLAGIVTIIFMLGVTYNVKNKIMTKVIMGNGVIIEKTIAFDKISNLMIHGIETELIPSNKEEAVISIDENLQYIVEFESNNGNVEIQLKRDSVYQTTKGVKVKLYYKNLDSLFIHYANCTGKLLDSNLYIMMSGSADVDFEFIGSKLDVICRNSSDVFLKGSCDSLNVNLANSSDLNSKELRANYCNVRAVNSSDVIVYVLKELNVDLANSSDLEYYGDGVLNKALTKNSSGIKKGE